MGRQLNACSHQILKVLILIFATALAGCSWVDDTGKQDNENPEIQLDAPFLSYEEGDVARIPVSDDDPVSALFELLESGPTVAGACGEFFSPPESADSLEQACAGYLSAEQCSIQFEANPDNDKEFIARIPALSRPLAQKYRIAVEDRTGASDERELELCLVAVNTAPIARADTQYQVVYLSSLTTEDQTYNELCERVSGDGVLSNDDDDFDAATANNSGPDCLRAELVDSPYSGFNLNAGGGFTFRSDGSVAPGGTHTFTYRANDGDLSSEPTEVRILVTGTNNPPTVPSEIRVSGPENTTTEIDVLRDAQDESDNLIVRSLGDPSSGSVVATDNQRVRYTPEQGFIGEDRFSVTIADPAGATASTTVIINVLEINDPPTINGPGNQSTYDVSDETAPYAERRVTATLGDEETPVQSLQATVRSSNAGVASARLGSGISGAGLLEVFIRPIANGTSTITLRVTDRALDNGLPAETTENQFTVRVSGVNTAPTARDDTATVEVDNTVTVNVLSNDSDPDNDTLRIDALLTSPSRGEASIDNNRIRYTADDEPGSDSIRYRVSDGRGGTAEATLRITVQQPNRDPSAGNDTFSLVSATSGTFDLSANDSDADGDALSYQLTDTAGLSASVNQSSGVLSVTAPTITANITRVLSYTVTDGRGGSDSATVTLTITAPVNRDPVAVNDAVSIASGGNGTLNVGANDSDPDGDSLSYELISTNGLAVTLDANSGVMSITAPTTNNGLTRTVRYRIRDGRGGTDRADVTVTITAAPNQAPTAGNDSIALDSGETDTLSVGNNDSDPDGDSLSYTLTNVPGDLSVALNANSGLMEITAPNTQVALTRSVTYQVSDGRGGTDTATVNVSVAAQPNAAPSAGDDAITLASGASGSINVGLNDSDPDGDTLSFQLTDADGLTVTLGSSSGVMSITAPATATEITRTVDYEIDDGRGGTDSASVSVTVEAAPPEPPEPPTEELPEDEAETT